MANEIVELIRQRQIAMNKAKTKVRIRKAPIMFTGITIENEYVRMLRKLIYANLRDLTNSILIPQLPRIVAEARALRPVQDARAYFNRFDGFAEQILSAMLALRQGFGRTVTDFDVQRTAEHIGELTSNFQRKQVTRVISSQVGVEVFIPEPWLGDAMKGFVESNVSLIKTVEERYFDQVENIAFRGAREGKRVEEISRDIQERLGVARSNADRIARDQTSKFFGELNQLRQEQVGVEEYTWRTARDNRVRASHASKEGKVYSWNKPPADTGHPSEEPLCRCYAEPKLEALFVGLGIAA